MGRTHGLDRILAEQRKVNAQGRRTGQLNAGQREADQEQRKATGAVQKRCKRAQGKRAKAPAADQVVRPEDQRVLGPSDAQQGG